MAETLVSFYLNLRLRLLRLFLARLTSFSVVSHLSEVSLLVRAATLFRLHQVCPAHCSLPVFLVSSTSNSSLERRSFLCSSGITKGGGVKLCGLSHFGCAQKLQIGNWLVVGLRVGRDDMGHGVWYQPSCGYGSRVTSYVHGSIQLPYCWWYRDAGAMP